MLEGVHHINFLVTDLETAIGRYRKFFELESVQIESLPERGVKTARFDVKGVWIVLVQPIDEDSEPMRHLRQYGEGLYLVSFAVDDLNAAKDGLAAKGAIDKSAKERDGLQGWRVIDLQPDAVFGALIQLTEDKKQSS